MIRYALELEYDGTPFVGWQRQPNGLSVQGVVEAALEIATGQSCLLQGAGRTDAGVHARAMAAHVDLAGDAVPSALRLREMLNALVRPHPIAVLSVREVAADWHARFSCIARHYRYRILNRRAGPALERNRVWWRQGQLDVEAMQAAANRLLGHHDFSSFRSSECQAKNPNRTLDALTLSRRGEEVWIDAAARSFLHHQVRIMVGTLVEVGRGRWTVLQVEEALAARNRAAAGPTAPPTGLYFTRAVYPET